MEHCINVMCGRVTFIPDILPVAPELKLGQGNVDDALPRLWHTLHHGPVPLVNLPPPEQVGQPLVQFLGFGLESNHIFVNLSYKYGSNLC